MPLTLASVLALPEVLRGAPDVVAGREHLDRAVRWVHVAEVPDIAELLHGGELLLTTGIGVGETAARQREFVSELAARSIAGLMLELGTRFQQAPRTLIEACEAEELPLIVLHRKVRFVTVTEAVLMLVADARVALLRHGEELHRQFTELVLSGAGPADLLQALADTVGNPVVLEGPGGELLYHASAGVAPADLLAAWDSFSRNLSSAPEGLARPVPPGQDDRPAGRLVALRLRRALTDSDGVALEQCATMVALALLHDTTSEALVHRDRGDFLAQLMSGSPDEMEASQRAATFGFRPAATLPLAIGRRTPAHSAGQRDPRWPLIARDLRRELDARQTPALIGSAGTVILLVIGLPHRNGTSAAPERAAELIAEITQRHFGDARASVVCAGRSCRTWLELADQMRQTLAALPAATQAEPQLWHDVNEPDLGRLLWMLRESEPLAAFVAAQLRPVVDHDRDRSSKLLPTLEALCHHGGSKSAAARTLHLDRSSMYSRIERLERLLHVDLSDPEKLLGIHFALHARRHIEPARVGNDATVDR